MVWLIPILTKVALWILPKLAGFVVDAFGKCLAAVEAAESIPNQADRRTAVMASLAHFSAIPEPVRRFLCEACVILFKLGVTSAQLEKMEELVSSEQNYELLGNTSKRDAVLNQFAELFPALPERIGRLLLELAVLKVKAAFKGAA